jgi:hypothetical protein
MASIPQRRPRQPDLRQLALPLDPASDTPPAGVRLLSAASSPSLRPAAVWPTFSPAQRAQAHRRILGVIEEVLREVRANG